MRGHRPWLLSAALCLALIASAPNGVSAQSTEAATPATADSGTPYWLLATGIGAAAGWIVGAILTDGLVVPVYWATMGNRAMAIAGAARAPAAAMAGAAEGTTGAMAGTARAATGAMAGAARQGGGYAATAHAGMGWSAMDAAGRVQHAWIAATRLAGRAAGALTGGVLGGSWYTAAATTP